MICKAVFWDTFTEFVFLQTMLSGKNIDNIKFSQNHLKQCQECVLGSCLIGIHRSVNVLSNV